jgi:hypothetical protein
MLTHGSKFFLGLAAFAFVVAAVYAGASGQHVVGMDTLIGAITLGYKGRVGDHLGYTVLIGLMFSALFLGLTFVALRDVDPEAGAQLLGTDTVPEEVAPTSVSYWPIVGAFSVGAMLLGIVVGKPLFVLGLVGVVITAAEWAIKAWADRATGDPEVNRSIRNRMMYPVEVPAIAVLGIGLFVLSISRLLLALPKGGSYAVFGLVPVVVLGVGWLIAVRPKVSSSLIAALLLVGGLAILAGGVFGAVHGERKFHVEKTKSEGSIGVVSPSARPVVRVRG